jgi:hypothetical protein
MDLPLLLGRLLLLKMFKVRPDDQGESLFVLYNGELYLGNDEMFR